MIGNVKCFMLTPAGTVLRSLRRYAPAGQQPSGRTVAECPLVPGQYSRHDTMVNLDVVAEQVSESEGAWPRDDPRWPKACRCGYVFQADDSWQLFTEHLWRSDTGEVMTLGNAPPGAMYYADWLTCDGWLGPDGKALMVVCPGGSTWHIDGEANNCTRKGDKGHKCWVRHGTPPNITVDKNGNTCSAGAGSIQTRNWHGFLRNGVFEKC